LTGKRRTIRSTLTLAFAVLAMVPFVVATLVAVIGAVRYLRSAAEETLTFDLEIARLTANRSLREASQHLDFITEALLRNTLIDGATPPDGRRLAETLLAVDSSAIVRVKAIDATGALVFAAGLSESDPLSATGGAGELFYLLEGDATPQGSQRFLPVELRDPGAPPGELGVIPAIAILQPVLDNQGVSAGVAVAEASLPALFDALDVASPGLAGTTGLVDMTGRFLYHSERKNDWASLLASQGAINLRTDFSEPVANAILGGRSGTVRTPTGSIVAFRPLADASLLSGGLFLYRSVPLSAVDARVRRFAFIASGFGLGMLALVLWMAALASRRLTRPIYALREATRRLAIGADTTPLHINTHDELEDLADDFTAMASVLKDHQQRLEDVVAARTHSLEVTRSELSQVVTHAADAIVGLDAHDRVRLWNRGACELFGFEHDEAIGHDIELLIRPEGPRYLHEAELTRQAMIDGRVVQLRTERRTKDGEVVAVALTQAPVTDDEHRRVGASLVIRDDRLQSRMEEQMRSSERLATASVMAAGLAHEINNPLAILGNRIELMVRQVDADSVFARDLAVLEQHVARLKELTSDLLGFAREDSDPQGRFRLNDLVDRAVRLFQNVFVSAGVSLEVHTEETVPEMAGNETAVETVVINLLLNAAQAAPAGGTCTVSVTTAQGGMIARLSVSDTGPGIRKELRARVFEPFFTTKEGSGTGLGLAVCRSIVDRHGGRLWIDEDFAPGARLVADFPTLSSETL